MCGTSQTCIRLVVLNYNGGQHILRCLEHLERLDWPRDRLDLVVVDNASSDGSDRHIEAAFPDVRLLRTGRNLGFPANNAALIDLDRVDFVGLVNSDAFVEPDWLTPLVAALENDTELGAACPKILFDARFRIVEIEAPTTTVPGDPRELGVRVSGVRLNGVDHWTEAGFLDGFYQPEVGPPSEPQFRWTGASATLVVPEGDEPTPFGRIELRLAGVPDASVTVRAGCPPVRCVLGTEPVLVSLATAGSPVDLVNNAGSRLIEGGYGGDRGFGRWTWGSSTRVPRYSRGVGRASCSGPSIWPTSGSLMKGSSSTTRTPTSHGVVGRADGGTAMSPRRCSVIFTRQARASGPRSFVTTSNATAYSCLRRTHRGRLPLGRRSGFSHRR